ncbi:N-acetylmuramoyl-L-alanine amidase [Nonomuraea sp. B12E4]|uniref:N-acetylmuramoyl-L-alanine amidase n=1 Tax=Nonomuraea sp. B12E4 TaxID=3153564 RepID=UPI00325F71AE
MQLWLAVVLTAGTLTAPAGFTQAAAPGRQAERPSTGRQGDFAAAAREYGVPESVLLGVAYLESRWDANAGQPSTAGGYGPMHLVDAFQPGTLSAGLVAGEASGEMIGDALGDGRGDPAHPMRQQYTDHTPTSALRVAQPPPQKPTLPEAGRLIGVDAARLRHDPTANIRAGAALLASYQERPSANPADWYGAVARYSGAEDVQGSHEFADEVFSVMRQGMERTTDDGHLVRLRPVAGLPVPGAARQATAVPGSRPVPDEQFDTDRPPANGPEIYTDDQTDIEEPPRSRWKPRAKKRRFPGYGRPGEFGATGGPGTTGQSGPSGEPGSSDGFTPDESYDTDDPGTSGYPGTYGQPEAPDEFSALGAAESPDRSPSGDRTECPESLTCEWMPAAHKRFGKKEHRGYGNHDRMSRTRAVDYIVIHDTEGTYQGIPSMIRNPRYVSWHYTIRSRDGHVAQHVSTRHIAWHAGNWDVNTRSIGIEHEGYLAKGGTWYTEAMYRASAKLVKYLAAKYDIPLNRAHILGHDNVPGTTPEMVAGMHEDPGPYWDWAHYFALMGKPFKPAKNGDSIIIRPSYNDHHPHFTGCVSTKPTQACPRHGAATVWLHKEPREDSPLILDVGKHGGKPSTYSVYDHSARASTGQRYAVAGTEGDWTAIWYLGQKAWFHNPPANPTAIPARGPVVTPLTSKVRVYGRAYPERSAYRLASYQALTPLRYRIAPGQEYTVGDTITGSYYSAHAPDPSRHVTTTGALRYHQIQLGHRVMFVMAKDVRLIR